MQKRTGNPGQMKCPNELSWTAGSFAGKWKNRILPNDYLVSFLRNDKARTSLSDEVR
jgi:hypothetical protein